MRFYGKYAATVITCGGSDPDDVEHYLHKILTQFGLRIVGGTGGVEMQFTDPYEKDQLLEASADLGHNLYAAIAQHKVIPEQEEQIRQTFVIMAWLVQTKQAEWKAAFEYWNTHWK